MAKKSRPTHEQLQRDEIADSFHETLELIHDNRRTILMAVLALILLAVAIFAYSNHRTNVKNELNMRVASLISAYDRIQAIPDAKTRTDATKNLINELDTTIKDYDTDTVLSRAALYLKGMAHYSLDQFPEARADYEKFVKAAETAEERARGEIALAYAYENQAFFPTTGTLTARSLIDDAIKHYKAAQQIARDEAPYLHDYAMLGEARCHEVSGNTDKAAELYSKVLKDRPAPTPVATPEEKEGQDVQSVYAKMLRERIKDAESQITLAATAQQRLDRLQARASLAPAGAVSVTTNTTTR